jgi:hypothetical protein
MDLQFRVFVFGSNLAGIHGAGAAAEAYRRGYPWGLGSGLSGTCYGIPTKNCAIDTLPLGTVYEYIKQFISHANNASRSFQVTRIGCGLAGFSDEVIAPMFLSASRNCYFDEAWRPWLSEFARYWGTYP